MFPIAAFGRLGGVSAKMLRAYDRLALFRPVWVDPSSGYRYYSPAQLPELRRILALRDVGVGLGEIKQLLDGRADLRDALERRRGELEQERRETERRLASLDIRVEMAIDTSPQVDVVLRRVPEEPVATLDLALVADTEDATAAGFYELEAHVRDLGRRAPRPPGALVEDAADDASRVEIFVPLSRPIASTDRIGYRRLPAAQLATVIHRGPYESMPDTAEQLHRWVEAASLTPVGPLRILYLQFGAEPELRVPRGFVVQQSADFVTELQLEVT